VAPEGGLHFGCKLIPEIPDAKLLEESIKQGIIFVPGSVYGSDSGYVRFTFARSKPEDIELGIAKFAKAIRRLME
jgi:GntR family transcriptional regulator of abcA and norABC